MKETVAGYEKSMEMLEVLLLLCFIPFCRGQETHCQEYIRLRTIPKYGREQLSVVVSGK